VVCQNTLSIALGRGAESGIGIRHRGNLEARIGDALVTGSEYGKVRAMMNERGEQVKEVGPGYPVEVLGLSGVPTAGDEFDVVEDEKAAKEVATHRAEKARNKEMASVKRATIEDLFAKAKDGGKVINIVVKADVQGSSEAVTQALQKCATKKVGVRILDSGVGVVTESDVLTAAAGKGIIVGFNTKPETKVALVEELLEKLNATPGVRSAADRAARRVRRFPAAGSHPMRAREDRPRPPSA